MKHAFLLLKQTVSAVSYLASIALRPVDI
jgi:hypothetical protein